VEEHLVVGIVDEVVNTAAYGYMVGRIAYRHNYCCCSANRDLLQQQRFDDTEDDYVQLGEGNSSVVFSGKGNPLVAGKDMTTSSTLV